MESQLFERITVNRLRLLGCLLLLEYFNFIVSGISFSYLSGNPYFSLTVDPLSIFLFFLRVPQFILGHHLLATVFDGIVLFSILLFIKNPFNNKIALVCFVLLLVYYITLMGYLTHRNYQIGFVAVLFPFLFSGKRNVTFAYEATRYFLLFFYFSAAILKFNSGAVFNSNLFSHILAGQFTPYFLEHNTGIRTNLNIYLVNHPLLAYLLYLASFIAELSAVIGFFTKKYDKALGVIFLIFHAGNWLIMDIGVMGQLSFISLLFLSRDFDLYKELNAAAA